MYFASTASIAGAAPVPSTSCPSSINIGIHCILNLPSDCGAYLWTITLDSVLEITPARPQLGKVFPFLCTGLDDVDDGDDENVDDDNVGDDEVDDHNDDGNDDGDDGDDHDDDDDEHDDDSDGDGDDNAEC